MRVERLSQMTKVVPLAAIARSEGFQFLDRLIVEWTEGSNRFSQPGEAIFGAFVGEVLVGTAGITVQRDHVGRVRRVYVHPAYRRQGIAKLLMDAVLTIGRDHFTTLVLYTETDEARNMYERLGFVPESPEGSDHATHRLEL